MAGIEIENSQFADVYENTATGNTGGLLVFYLPASKILVEADSYSPGPPNSPPPSHL